MEPSALEDRDGVVTSGEVGSVAYSEPIDGKMFSPALRDTNRAKGTSQIWRKKKDAISVKLGYVIGQRYGSAGGFEKC